MDLVKMVVQFRTENQQYLNIDEKKTYEVYKVFCIRTGEHIRMSYKHFKWVWEDMIKEN